MDVEKLIERLEAWNEQHLSVVCGSGHFACDYLCESEDCIVVQAATALSTLQAENEKLREKIEDARLEGYVKGLGEMSEENERLWAELEQVKAEKDAAVESIPHECKTCVYHTVFFNGCTLDHDCTNPDGGCSNNYDRWKWRGQKED